jgi:hypothetical protein
MHVIRHVVRREEEGAELPTHTPKTTIDNNSARGIQLSCNIVQVSRDVRPHPVLVTTGTHRVAPQHAQLIGTRLCTTTAAIDPAQVKTGNECLGTIFVTQNDRRIVKCMRAGHG